MRFTDSAVFVPGRDVPAGEYDLLHRSCWIPQTRQPKVKLAITGIGADGWYSLGKVTVE